MSTLTKLSLRRRIFAVLRRQGYSVRAGSFALTDNSRENRRAVHMLARTERMSGSEEFIVKTTPLIEKYLVDGSKIEIDRIDPQIVEVREGTLHETIFKWWNLVWWSLPYERAYGRQMRFVVWDRYHNAPIGLIGLQSPILSWGVRDKKLGIAADQRDYWVNQSMSAQRLRCHLPPEFWRSSISVSQGSEPNCGAKAGNVCRLGRVFVKEVMKTASIAEVEDS